MTGVGFAEEVAATALSLAQAAGVPLLVTVGLLLVASLLLVAARHLPRLSLPKIGGEAPPPYRPNGVDDLPGTPVPQADPNNPGGDCK